MATPIFRAAIFRVSRHKKLCCLGAAVFVLALRALLLPVWPMPVPIIHDEFAYLLEADTFAHGRLTNPPHPMWRFFESEHILQQPTYMGRYPPAQGLAMAAGQVLFGHPWFGVWLTCGLLAAAFCWALQGWVPPRWALLGTALSIQICFYNYWMNSYWGGAAAAVGGALVIGAWPRVTRMHRFRHAWTLGVGAVIVMLARPFEGSLLLVPVLAALFLRNRRPAVWVPVVICGVAGAAWLGLYYYQVTGSPFRMPYTVYQSRYESIPQFNVLPVAPGVRNYGHLDLEWFDHGWLLNAHGDSRSWKFPGIRMRDWYVTLKTILGSAVLIIPLLGFAPRLWRSGKTRFLVALSGLIVAGSLIEVAHFPHYVAPFAAVFLILCVQSVRYLGPIAPLFAVLVVAWNLAADARHIVGSTTPDRLRPAVWRKGEMERNLAENTPGRHVIFVRYTRYLEPHAEWIYNSSSIDSQPVIWAQDMGDEENRRLIAYYPGRAFWRFEPDEPSPALQPYQ